MRAVYVDIPEELIIQRRQWGVDAYDEMWDGELHMTPLPSWFHQRESLKIADFFLRNWEELGEGVVCEHVGIKPRGTVDVDVAGERVPRNYRGPDIVFLRKGHEQLVQGGWVIGPPDAVLEIRSPGDETYEKLPFYHALGVPEVIVVHRDSKAVEVYARGEDAYERVPVQPDGSVHSAALPTSFRTEIGPEGSPPVLRMRRLAHPEREGAA